MKLFNTIAASVAVAMAAGVAQADVNSQLASLQAQVNQLQSQVNGMGSSSMGGLVGINSPLSWQMMGNMTGVGKEMNLLQARQAGLNTPVTIGGYAQANLMYGHTNTNSNFGSVNDGQYALSTNSSSGNANATRLLLSNVNLATTAAIGQWVTGYVQVGGENIGDTTNSGFGIQDAYLTFGNLAKNPVFAFVGNKDIDFGSFATVDMFNQPLTRDLFESHGNTAGVGVSAYGFNGVVSAMNGGSFSNNNNFGLSTTNQNNVSNYAVNLSYGMTNSGVNWNIGAGYLNGTQFTSTSGSNNGAWDLNGKISVAGFDFLAEYVATTKQTNGSNILNANGVPTVLSGGGAAGRAAAYSLGADYNFPVMGLNSAVSAEYSHAAFNGSSSMNLQQYVLGYRIQALNNVWTGIEYAYNKGNVLNSGVPSNAVKNSSVVLNVTTAF